MTLVCARYRLHQRRHGRKLVAAEMWLGRVAAMIVAGLALTACDSAVGGTAAPGPATSSGRASLPLDVAGGLRAETGQCLDTSRATVVNCVRPHDAEVIKVDRLPADLPPTLPDEPTITGIAMPVCRAGMTGYLGSTDADATNLMAWALWPTEQGWTNGERWLLCTVAEVGSGDAPRMRTGSLRGALAGDGFYRFQTCSAGSPSKDEQLRKTPCHNEHLGEALPGVISVGGPADALPQPDTINEIAQRECGSRLVPYLGTVVNLEVRPAWRIPNSDAWARGYTNVVCYAEPVRTVTVRLRDLGASPLPT